MNIQKTDSIHSIPFFFIIGRPRSGTTLLRTMLDAHPNTMIPLESPFIKNLYPAYHKKTNWSKKDLLAFYNTLLEQPQFRFWTIDKEKLKNDLLEHEGRITFGDLCKIVYLACHSFFEKEEIKILGDKNPPYTLYIPILLKVFPDARFIYITRDHRDNILSMMNVDFEKAWLSSLAYRWRFYNLKFKRSLKKYPERFFIIKYEDLVTDPEKYMKDICNFLGLPYSANMLNYHSKEQEIRDTIPKELIERYHKSLFEPISPKKIGLWKTKMNDADIRKSDMIVGRYAEIMGYERKYKKKNIFLYLSCIPGIIYGRSYYIIAGAIDLLPGMIRTLLFKMISGIYRPWWKNNYEAKK